MESSLQTFSNALFGEIRIVVENETPMFAASDICNVLGYSNPRKAVADHCRGVTKRDTPTKNQYGAIVVQQIIAQNLLSKQLANVYTNNN